MPTRLACTLRENWTINLANVKYVGGHTLSFYTPYQLQPMSNLYSTIGDLSQSVFSECLAHDNHPNFMKSLGHRPRAQVILLSFVQIHAMSATFCNNSA